MNMKSLASVTGLFLALASASQAVPTVIPLLSDGFEGYPDGQIGQGLPSTATVNPPPPGAMGDPANVTGSVTQGGDTVNPRNGNKMLQFINTQYEGGGDFGLVNEGINTDVYYLIDLAAYAASIATGTASIHLSAWFNTGASGMHNDPGDPNYLKVDNAYFLDLRAWSGDLVDFPADLRSNPISPNFLAGYTNFDTPLLTDRNEATWEMSWIDLALPAGTTYVMARIAPSENFHHNSTGDDFVSSFADDVRIELTLPDGFVENPPEPEPGPNPVPESGSSLLLFSMAIAGLTAVRQRRSKDRKAN